MVEAESRVGVPPTKRALTWLGMALLTGLGAAACSGGHSDGSPAADRRTTTTLSVTDQQVIQGWKAAEQAFYAAALTNNAASPALAATMVDPQLSQARQFLFAAKSDGYVGQGSFSLGNPVVIGVTGTTARVSSCIFDGVVEVDAKTGKPAPAPYGVAERATEQATLVEVGPGLWKESHVIVSEGSCAPS